MTGRRLSPVVRADNAQFSSCTSVVYLLKMVTFVVPMNQSGIFLVRAISACTTHSPTSRLFFFTGVHFRSRTIISGEFPETHVVVTRLVLQLSKLLFSWFLPSFVLSLFVLLTGVLASAAKR